MAAKKSGRAGGIPPARPDSDSPVRPDPHAGVKTVVENTSRGETKVMPSYGTRTQTHTQTEGVTVIGEAVRRILSESAEVIIEITVAAPTAAQATRDNHTKTMQVVQALTPLGVEQGDVQPISLKLQNLYSPMLPALPAYAGLPPMGQ